MWKVWVYDELRKLNERLDRMEGIQREILSNQQKSEKELKKMAESISEQIVREATETRGAVNTVLTVLRDFSAYVQAHLNDPAALQSALNDLQGAQDDIAAAIAENPLPGEVVVVPPEV